MADPTGREGRSEHAATIALLLARLRQHSRLGGNDERLIGRLRLRIERLRSGQEVVRQGDRPTMSVFVVSGMLGRYHTLANGSRQYLSLHISSDMPDVQSLLLGQMDHALAAIGPARIALFEHTQLKELVGQSPTIASALWRETLLDAAIFRQAITTNGARKAGERVAHLLSEQYARAWQAGITENNSCALPLSQIQIGQVVGLSVVTVNRALQQLRQSGCAELRDGRLTVLNWRKLQTRALFDPTYLSLDLRGSGVHAPRLNPRAP